MTNPEDRVALTPEKAALALRTVRYLRLEYETRISTATDSIANHVDAYGMNWREIPAMVHQWNRRISALNVAADAISEKFHL